MKTCHICGLENEASVETCTACGEASWVDGVLGAVVVEPPVTGPDTLPETAPMSKRGNRR